MIWLTICMILFGALSVSLLVLGVELIWGGRKKSYVDGIISLVVGGIIFAGIVVGNVMVH